MEKAKAKVSVKLRQKGKPIKPKMGRGTGGFITTTLIAKVKKDRAKSKKE